uniref:Uncharacterized protein n=1 Tax=Chromera velia CCMP2878 TaxID=1169474 RepID=A0A0G4IB18_9ALVE|eukprot:Cvel_12622.t1-p1 / transcript=Cvel_12622.t1 / gene=Cvel_12622 / organism=Chromera_velia_CCMP2878 / gene_product=hypothetical protein / transcript_product=hypothetical protein / location=Cvel_scaffold833:12260-12741(-) / protein_length=78 / sequence_SO=supercontig / SO=protein_coding / is_pseudo=false
MGHKLCKNGHEPLQEEDTSSYKRERRGSKFDAMQMRAPTKPKKHVEDPNEGPRSTAELEQDPHAVHFPDEGETQKQPA